MKKNIRVLLSLLLLFVVLFSNTLGQAKICYAKTKTVKVTDNKDEAKTIKLNTTYVVSGFKEGTECFVAYTLKEDSKLKIKVSNAKTGTTYFRIKSGEEGLRVSGYSESIYHHYDETSSTIDATDQKFPAGKYYIVFEASKDSDGSELLKSCNVKITIVK